MNFSNTDISLAKRIAIERFYHYLLNHEDVFSPDGTILGQQDIKYVSPTGENFNELLTKISSFIHGVRQIRGEEFISDDMTIQINELSYNELNFSDLPENTHGYRYYYIYTIEANITWKDNELGQIFIPFIFVENQGSPKVFISPYCNQFANIEIPDKDKPVILLNFDAGTIYGAISNICENLTPNDMLYIKLINNIPAGKYTYRSFNGVAQIAKASNFVITPPTEDKDQFTSPIPVVDLSIDGDIGRILTTDQNKFYPMSYEEYLNSNSYAVVVQHYSLYGDLFIASYGLEDMKDDVIPLNCNLYYKREKLVEVPQGESMVYQYVQEWFPSGEEDGFEFGMVKWVKVNPAGYGEDGDGKIDTSKMTGIEKIAAGTMNTFKKLIKGGKNLINSIKKAHGDMTYITYINEWLDDTIEFLIIASTTVGLFILVGPITAIIGGVLATVYQNFDKVKREDDAINKVKEMYEKQISKIDERISKEEDKKNMRGVKRLNKVKDDLRQRIENIEKVRSGRGGE